MASVWHKNFAKYGFREWHKLHEFIEFSKVKTMQKLAVKTSCKIAQTVFDE